MKPDRTPTPRWPTAVHVVLIAATTGGLLIDASAVQAVAGIALAAAAVLGAVRRRTWPYLLPLGAVGLAGLGAQLVLIPAMFSLGLRARTWSSMVCLGLAAAVLAVGPPDEVLVISAGENALDHGVLNWVLLCGLLVVLPYVAGTALGVRRELVGALHERADRAERERDLRTREAVLLERARIAREAHDVLGHKLSLVSLQAGGLEVNRHADARVTEQAALIRRSARDAMTDLRAIIAAVEQTDEETLSSGRPVTSDPPPELAGIRTLVESSRRSGAHVRLELDEVADEWFDALPLRGRRALYRVVQESLANAHRHGAPSAAILVRIANEPDSGVEVSVSNAVRGSGHAGNGRGLAGLHQLMQEAGGTLTVRSEPERFQIRATLPVPAPDGAVQDDAETVDARGARKGVEH